jgi:hypothetical protein
MAMSFIGLCIYCFILKRVDWVHKVQTKHIKKALLLIQKAKIELLYHGESDEYKYYYKMIDKAEKKQDELISYDKMMKKFWIWNVNKLQKVNEK